MLGEQLGRGGKISSKIDAHDLAAFVARIVSKLMPRLR